MDNSIKESLDNEIQSNLNELMDLELCGEERANGVRNVSDLYRLRIEEKKLETENKKLDIENKRLDIEKEKIEKQLKFDKKDSKFKWVIAGAELVVPIVAYGIWYHEGLKFEQENVFRSTTLKNLINRFRPSK